MAKTQNKKPQKSRSLQFLLFSVFSRSLSPCLIHVCLYRFLLPLFSLFFLFRSLPHLSFLPFSPFLLSLSRSLSLSLSLSLSPHTHKHTPSLINTPINSLSSFPLLPAPVPETEATLCLHKSFLPYRFKLLRPHNTPENQLPTSMSRSSRELSSPGALILYPGLLESE